MLIGMAYPYIPGIQGNASWQIPMGLLFLVGIVSFYLGCLRAARLAEKAYFASKNSDAKESQSPKQD
jgi:hypothetical protein